MEFKEEIYESMKKDYFKMSEEVKKLKRELELEKLKNDFLMKRENKLQMIEQYVNKKEVKLETLLRIIKRRNK